jgi:hypothetical protein
VVLALHPPLMRLGPPPCVRRLRAAKPGAHAGQSRGFISVGAAPCPFWRGGGWGGGALPFCPVALSFIASSELHKIRRSSGSQVSQCLELVYLLL